MERKQKKTCCVTAETNNYVIEAVVSVDERGQMVLPKEVREKAGIRPGDKLAIAIEEQSGKVCCIYLLKTEVFQNTLREVINPVFPTNPASK